MEGKKEVPGGKKKNMLTRRNKLKGKREKTTEGPLKISLKTKVVKHEKSSTSKQKN